MWEGRNLNWSAGTVCTNPSHVCLGGGITKKKKGERGVNSISFPGDLNPKQILIGRMIGSALNWVGL